MKRVKRDEYWRQPFVRNATRQPDTTKRGEQFSDSEIADLLETTIFRLESRCDANKNFAIGEPFAKAMIFEMQEAARRLRSARSERVTLPPEANELAAMMRDAKRYRWLRSAYSIMPGKPGARPVEWYCDTEADAAIDAAMRHNNEEHIRTADRTASKEGADGKA